MPGSSAANADDPNEARTFWGLELGDASSAPWQIFVAALEVHLRKVHPDDALARPPVERVLRYAFGGHPGTAVVRCQDLEKFLRRFGPMDVAIFKARKSLFGPDGQLLPWFHGELSRERAEALLSGKPAGSFLFRFSESRPDNISVSYLEIAQNKDGAAPASATVLRNSLLHNAGRHGFGLASASSSSSSRRAATWPTLVAFIESFARRLSRPVPSGLYEQCQSEIDADKAAAVASAAAATTVPSAAAAAAVAAPPAVPETPPRSPPDSRSCAPSSPGALSPLPPPPPSPPWRAPALPAAELALAQNSSAAAAPGDGNGIVQRLRVARRLYSQAQALAIGDGPALPVLGSSGASAAAFSSYYGGGGGGADGMPSPPTLAQALSGSPAYGSSSGVGAAAGFAANGDGSSNGGFALASGGSSGSSGVFPSGGGIYNNHGGGTNVYNSHGSSGVFNSFGGSSDDAIAGKAAAATEVLALLDRVFATLAEPGVVDAHLEAKALRLRGDVQLACKDPEAAVASFTACLAAASAALRAQEAVEDDSPAAGSSDRSSIGGGGSGGGGGGTSSASPGAAALPASLGAVQAHAHRELASLRLAACDPAAALEHFAGLIEYTTDPDSRRAILEAWRRKPAFREAIESAGWSEAACEAALEVGVSHFRAGEYDAAAEGFRRALLIARCVVAGRLEARALGNLATANKKARRLGEAVSQYRACLLLLRQLRDGEKEKTILNFLVLCCMEASRWTQAWRFNDQLLALAENRANVEMLNRRRDQIAAAAGWRTGPGHGHGSARAPSPAR